MSQRMTKEENEQYIATLQLLLGDKNDIDIIYVLNTAFPQFKMLFAHQLQNLRDSLDDLTGKAQLMRASI